MTNKTGKDLTKEAPRSPHAKVGGFSILARATDKCRALLWGSLGEYEFDCELDKTLFDWKGLKGDDFKSYVSEGHSDKAIGEWVREHGDEKTDAEIAAWNEKVIMNNYADDAEGKAWLDGRNKDLGLDKDGTLFDMLDADDKASFKNSDAGGVCPV